MNSIDFVLGFISNDQISSVEKIERIEFIASDIFSDSKDEFWNQSCRELFMAIVLYLIDEKNINAALLQIYELSKKENFNELLKNIVENTTKYDKRFYSSARKYLDSSEKTRHIVLKVFSCRLENFSGKEIN